MQITVIMLIKVTLVVYGNNADVPDLTVKEAPVIIKWFNSAMDNVPVKEFNIVHVNSCYYEISWKSDPIISIESVCDPDPYGNTPIIIDSVAYIVDVTPASVSMFKN